MYDRCITCEVDSISLEGSFLRWPEVGVRVRQATDGSRKFGMTVEHDTKSGEDVVGWVKVKWDHGAEENCRVGAEGKLSSIQNCSLFSFQALKICLVKGIIVAK